MIEKPVKVFLDDLASDSPAPGGGAAAAIVAATGAALVSMVCRLTLGKKGYESVEDEIKDVLTEAERLRGLLQQMVEADAHVFNQVMGAYRLPKATEAEAQQRSAAIQESLKAATDVPMACAECCVEVIRLSRIVADRGNRNVVSDAGVAVMAAYAGVKSAALNVYVNTGVIKDGVFVGERVSKIESLLAEAEAAVGEVFDMVKRKV